MYELYEWIREHRHSPLTFAALVPLIIIILDKLGRELITDQLKKVFHIHDQSEFKNYAANQQRIERKIDELAKHLGVPEWSAVETHYIANSVKSSWMSSLLERLSARHARQYTTRRRSKMKPSINYVTLIPALIGVLKLFLQPFGIDLSQITDAQVNDFVNGISALLAIIGIFMTHKKAATYDTSSMGE